jgi:hypothetical protein
VIWDEDVRIHIRNCGEIIPGDFYQTITGVALIPVYYKTGAAGYWRRKAANGYALLDPAFTGFTRMAYNFNPGAFWNPQEAAQNGFVAVWLVATNNRLQPIIALCGQREDQTLNNARANNTYEGLDLGVGGLGIVGPPFREFRQLYRLIFQTNNGYANTPKARLRDVLDLRRITTIPSGTYAVTSHSSLSGLGRDDHAQYLLGGNLITRVALTATQNDYAPAGIQNTQFLLLDPDAAWSITGIIAPDGTYREDGKVLIVCNVDAALSITLNNENAGSAAANRLALGADVTLGPGQSTMLIYDLTAARWRPAGGSGGGGAEVIISPAQITANTNDYNPAGLQTATVMRLSTDVSRNLTGITALTAGNRAVKVFNIGATDLVLKHEDVASVAANRFYLGIDLTLAANEGCTLWYDTTSARWRCCGRHI